MAKGKNIIASEGPGRVLRDRQTSSRPAGPAGPGDETHARVREAQEGGSRAEAAGTRSAIGPGHASLSHAVHELHSQHPHHHSAGGIHHTTDHHRHMVMGGLEVGSHKYQAKAGGAPKGYAHPQHPMGHHGHGAPEGGHRHAGSHKPHGGHGGHVGMKPHGV